MVSALLTPLVFVLLLGLLVCSSYGVEQGERQHDERAHIIKSIKAIRSAVIIMQDHVREWSLYSKNSWNQNEVVRYIVKNTMDDELIVAKKLLSLMEVYVAALKVTTGEINNNTLYLTAFGNKDSQ